MSITLYYGSGSPYAWRAQLALEHKALAYERKLLSFSAGDTRKPEFIALNPRHEVPSTNRTRSPRISTKPIRAAASRCFRAIRG